MNVAVLGAGTEGRDVAFLCARAGHAVNLHSTDATRAMDRIDDIERKLVDAAADGEISLETKSQAVDDLQATTDLEAAVADAEVVVETTETETTALQERVAAIEASVDRETLVVTTASSVSVTTVAAGLRHPDRAIGLHVFDLDDPSVVELIVADQTTSAATERAEAFLETLSVSPVRVRDAPGIVSNRLELAFELEAMRAVADGVASVEGVDRLATEGLHQSVGPLERADRAGLERRLALFEEFRDALGQQFTPPELLAELVEAGKTGLAAGEGFYRWEGGEPVGGAVGEAEIPARTDRPDDSDHP